MNQESLRIFVSSIQTMIWQTTYIQKPIFQKVLLFYMDHLNRVTALFIYTCMHIYVCIYLYRHACVYMYICKQ